MACDGCKKVVKTAGMIAKGYSALAVGKKYEFTDDRIFICRKCEKNYWIRGMLWCSVCKCLIAAKARVKEAECPLSKWEKIGDKNGS